MKAIITLPVTLLFAAIAAAPALAAPGPTLSASLSNLKFTAIDLTPDDGRTAQFSLADEKLRFYNELYNYFGTPSFSTSLRPAVDEVVNSDFAYGPFRAQGNLDWASGSANHTLSWNRDVAVPPRTNFNLYSSVQYGAKLTLSAGSAIVLSGHLEQSFIAAGYNRWNDAGSSFAAFLSPTDQSVGQSASIDANHMYRGDFYHDDWDEKSDFAVTLTNSSDSDMSVDVIMYFNSSMRTNAGLDPLTTLPGAINPVPEPSTYAMLGAGLALLGGLARRRARRAT